LDSFAFDYVQSRRAEGAVGPGVAAIESQFKLVAETKMAFITV